MAWIAVHEQIDGKKLRELRKTIDCSKCEALGILITLWLWGINNATPTGEITAADREDIAEVFQGSISRKKATMAVVEALISTGWLDDIGGHLYIHDWEEWQEQWFKAMARREKDKQRKRLQNDDGNSTEIPENTSGNSTENPRKFHGKSSATVTVTVTKPSPLPKPSDKPTGDIPPIPPVEPAAQPSVPKPQRKNPSTLTKAQEELFNGFWAVYPRKVSIGDAEKAWKKISPDAELAKRIVEAVAVAMTFDIRFRETRFTPHPATWLNARGWESQYDGPEDRPPLPPRGGKPDTLGVLEQMLNEEGGNRYDP